MKLCAISDTHGLHWHVKLPTDCDVLVHAGDMTLHGNVEELKKVAMWFRALLFNGAFKHVVVIAGNHDFGLETKDERREVCEKMFTWVHNDGSPGLHYLHNTSVTLDGKKFYGSPYQPEFNQWAFNLRRGEELMQNWKKIPGDTNVLITHGPPRNVLDQVGSEHVGDSDLSRYLRRLSLDAHVFGHIHEGYGISTADGNLSINASVCDRNYRPIHKPIEIEI